MSQAIIRNHLEALASLASVMAGRSEAIARLAERYAGALRGGGTLFFAGNGGSAAHAQHIAAEYVVRLGRTRRPFRALALSVDTSVVTAAGNDLGFAEVFARQIEALAGPGDVVVLVSTSGQSENLIRAAEAARRVGAAVVALLGRGGGALAALCDDAVIIPSDESSWIQELQLAIDHTIVLSVERELAPCFRWPASRS